MRTEPTTREIRTEVDSFLAFRAARSENKAKARAKARLEAEYLLVWGCLFPPAPYYEEYLDRCCRTVPDWASQVDEKAAEISAEKKRRARAKGLAKRIGLHYWPALLADPVCDWEAFLVAEEVLAAKEGRRLETGRPVYWGQILLDGTMSHGGWDSMGHWGPSAKDVEKMWFAAGCRDSEKFRWQVANGFLLGKGMSLAEGKHYRRGKTWADKHVGHLPLGTQALTALGRLSPALRWAAVQGLNETLAELEGAYTTVVHPFLSYKEKNIILRARHLNWAEVSRMQRLPKWRRATAPYLPRPLRWELQGFPINRGVSSFLEESAPGLLPSDLVPALGRDALRTLLDSGNAAELRPAFAAAQLFRKELPRWLRETGSSLHDAGQPCQLVEESELADGAVRMSWLRLVWATKGAALEYASKWGEIRAVAGHVPTTLAELRKLAALIRYEGVTEEFSRLAETCASLNLSQYHFDGYKGLVAKAQADHETVPWVRVTGSDVGLEGAWELRRIDSDDPIGPMLGLVTNCCQHLHGEAKSCAKRIWDHPDASAWVVLYRGGVVAQSYVWRHKDRLVIDSVEALSSAYVEALSSAYVEGIAALYQAAAKQVVGRLGVEEVCIGHTSYGITKEVRSLMQVDRDKIRHPEGCPSSYSDAESVYKILTD